MKTVMLVRLERLANARRRDAASQVDDASRGMLDELVVPVASVNAAENVLREACGKLAGVLEVGRLGRAVLASAILPLRQHEVGGELDVLGRGFCERRAAVVQTRCAPPVGRC